MIFWSRGRMSQFLLVCRYVLQADKKRVTLRFLGFTSLGHEVARVGGDLKYVCLFTSLLHCEIQTLGQGACVWDSRCLQRSVKTNCILIEMQ